MERDFNGYNMPPFMDYNTQIPPNGINSINDLYSDPMFNPVMQYEQAYCYYRYLCMQMEYKIKCKEYEKMCNTNNDSLKRENIEKR